MAKTCTKTFIKRGQEIDKENLKPNGIYAVRYTLPAEVASLCGTTQEQWGIVMFKDGKVRLSWNVESYNKMYEGDIYEPWRDNLTYFRSVEMERSFLTNFVMRMDEFTRYEKKLRDYSQRIDNLQRHFDAIMNNVFHKIAERLRIFFS